jgi:hypothetical protein
MRSIFSLRDDVAHAMGKNPASAFLVTGMMPPSIVLCDGPVFPTLLFLTP